MSQMKGPTETLEALRYQNMSVDEKRAYWNAEKESREQAERRNQNHQRKSVDKLSHRIERILAKKGFNNDMQGTYSDAVKDCYRDKETGESDMETLLEDKKAIIQNTKKYAKYKSQPEQSFDEVAYAKAKEDAGL
jgi:hypothetical protein